MACLEKDPARRPQQARELAATLTRYRAKIATHRARRIAPRHHRETGAAADARPLRRPARGVRGAAATAERGGHGGEPAGPRRGRNGDRQDPPPRRGFESLAHARSLRGLAGRPLRGARSTRRSPTRDSARSSSQFLRRAPSRSSAPLPRPGARSEPELAALFPALADLLSAREPAPPRASESPAARAPPLPRAARRRSQLALRASWPRRWRASEGGRRAGAGARGPSRGERVGGGAAVRGEAPRVDPHAPRRHLHPDRDRSRPPADEADRRLQGEQALRAPHALALPYLRRALRARGRAHRRDAARQRAHAAPLRGRRRRTPTSRARAPPLFSPTRGPDRATRAAPRVVSSRRGSRSPDALPETMQKAVERRVERLLRGASLGAARLPRCSAGASKRPSSRASPRTKATSTTRWRSWCVEASWRSSSVGRGDRLAFTSRTVRDASLNAASIPPEAAEPPPQNRRGARGAVPRAPGARLPAARPPLRAGRRHPAKVTEFGLKLARTALAGYAAEDAVRAAKAVLGSLDDEKAPEAAEARTLLAAAYRMRGDAGLALKEIELAVTARDASGGGGARALDLVAAAEIAWEARRTGEAKRWIDRGLRAPRAAGDQESLRRLLRLGTTAGQPARRHEPGARAGRRGAERIGATHSEAARRHAQRSGPRRDGELRSRAGVDGRAGRRPQHLFRDVDPRGPGRAHRPLARRVLRGREEEGRRFRFRLRQGARFHDGRPFTAADVRYSFERLKLTPTAPTGSRCSTS